MRTPAAAPSRPTRARRVLYRSVTVVVLLVVAFGVGEGVVRAAKLAPDLIPLQVTTEWGTFEASPNPELGWVPRAGSGDISSYGIRDREYPEDKAPGSYRIVVLGDSIGFGYCVGDLEAIFHSRAEDLLDADPSFPYEDVEVINLSVSGYDTRQQVEFFEEKGARLDPDLVLVSFCLNDFEVASIELRKLEEQPGWEHNQQLVHAMRRYAFTRSHLARMAIARWPAISGRLNHQVQSQVAAEAEQAKVDEHGGHDRVLRGFEKLDGLSEEQGFDVLVVVWPALEELDRDYAYQRIHDRAHAHARAMGFDVLDLLGPLSAVAPEGDATPLRCDRWHPNEEGHRVAADVLAEHLLERLRPPHG